MFNHLGIPEKYKTAVILGIVAFFLILVILVINAITRFANSSDKNKLTADASNPDLTKLSYPEASYKDAVAGLKFALQTGSSLPRFLTPTNTTMALDILSKMKTYEDLLYLIKIFGVSDGKMLQEWVGSEFSEEEINTLNNVLVMNKINYKFRSL